MPPGQGMATPCLQAGDIVGKPPHRHRPARVRRPASGLTGIAIRGHYMRHIASVLAIGAIALVATACSTTGGGSPSAIDGNIAATARRDPLEAHVVRRLRNPDGRPAGVAVDARFAAATSRARAAATCTAVPPRSRAPRSSRPARDDPDGLRRRADEPNRLSRGSRQCRDVHGDRRRLDAVDNGVTLLAYAAGPANPLEGDWNVTGYNNGKEAVTSPTSGTSLTATFRPTPSRARPGAIPTTAPTPSMATRSRSARSRRPAWRVTRRSWSRRRCSWPRWRHRRRWSRLARRSPFAMPPGRPR